MLSNEELYCPHMVVRGGVRNGRCSCLEYGMNYQQYLRVKITYGICGKKCGDNILEILRSLS